MKKNLFKVLSVTVLAIAMSAVFAACGPTVTDSEFASISVITANAKTEYTVGDSFSQTGLVVVGKLGDDTLKRILLKDVEFSGFNSASPVESQTITVTYQEKTTDYIVKINPIPEPDDDIPPYDFPIVFSGGYPGSAELTVTLTENKNYTLTGTGAMEGTTSSGTWLYSKANDAFTFKGNIANGVAEKANGVYTLALNLEGNPFSLTFKPSGSIEPEVVPPFTFPMEFTGNLYGATVTITLKDNGLVDVVAGAPFGWNTQEGHTWVYDAVTDTFTFAYAEGNTSEVSQLNGATTVREGNEYKINIGGMGNVTTKPEEAGASIFTFPMEFTGNLYGATVTITLKDNGLVDVVAGAPFGWNTQEGHTWVYDAVTDTFTFAYAEGNTSEVSQLNGASTERDGSKYTINVGGMGNVTYTSE